jgi:hypothetical protein
LLYLLPEPHQFNEIRLTCAPDTFFEVLTGNIRNALISFQAWQQKIKMARTNCVIINLNRLKANYNENSDEIFRLEHELVKIRDEDLTVKIREIKLFESLHNEKPSPLFLTLIKSNKLDSLQCIKDDNGQHFVSDASREEHIVKFFAKIYKRPVDYNQCIEDFLGEEILNNPVITNSKLTVQEQADLDRPLTIEELDESLKHCNPKSAPGADGFSNKLIKLCWNFLRIPLFNYANYCFSKGILTPNFRSACIRLIPKKGDSSQLKNWRPISLLSNLYKIVSRAINTRLNKVVNRICSQAQKGYNNKRYVQEVLINVCETIAHCKNRNIRGSVLAVDMAKAFDSLNHDFIKSVLKFFGFGNTIMKWISLLGIKRRACIIMDSGKNSSFFDIETGSAQGDNPSPNLFNFFEQILIFKLELDKGVARIPRPVPVGIIPGGGVYSAESNRETDINESLADDNTVLSVIDRNSLLTIKYILTQFADISGLQCNFDKTTLLPIFPVSDQELEWITEAGFTISPLLKLLGAEITSNYEEITRNFDRIHEKIVSLINYWSRFKLSLPGRIAISKTFLVSQINYLGCIFKPSDAQLGNIQAIINNFIWKNLRISDARMYLPAKKGGIGFFDLKKFLGAQRCTWLLRAKKIASTTGDMTSTDFPLTMIPYRYVQRM